METQRLTKKDSAQIVEILNRDGVIVIPSGDAASLYDAARQSHERDLAKTENARRGLFDRGWVDGALERKGCEIVEGPWR